jgi:hypothetical protein
MMIQLIFGGMSLAVLAGVVGFQLLGSRYATRHPNMSGGGFGTIEAAVFALLGLLVAFSFSGAEARLQSRRDLIVKEVDAVSTAYLRLAMLPASDRPALEEDFRQYVDTRIAYYHHLLDRRAARAERARCDELQQRIWTRAVASTWRSPDERAALIVLPALNEMFDVTTAREAALRMHIPLAIFVFLALLAFVCAFLAGTEMAGPGRLSPVHVFTFGGAMALTAYIILNIEFPRAGFVRLEYLDALLAQFRATMK